MPLAAAGGAGPAAAEPSAATIAFTHEELVHSLRQPSEEPPLPAERAGDSGQD